MADSFDELAGLLFFDTFSHEVNEDLNLDLVQFPKPVYITEVRIIPLGARVQADFPGGVRLGATNPSKFHIEFFVNDLGKPGASTFEALGDFEYNQNDCINLECIPKESRQIPTDGLVLRGCYTTITLAVYGMLTKNITEDIIAPPPAAPAQPMVPVVAVTPTPVNVPEESILPIDSTDVIATSSTVEWRPSDDSQPVPVIVEPIPTRDESIYTTATTQSPFTSDTYDSTNYTQPSCQDSHDQKRDHRLERRERVPISTSHERHESSESDWDRDEREELELAKRRELERSPTERSPNRGSQSNRSDSIRSYSRSSSKDRDRTARVTTATTTTGRQRSSEYRHSRSYSSRSSQHDRSGKNEKSRDRRSSDKEYECKRPRTPPTNTTTESPIRTKSPERLSTSSPSVCSGDENFKSSTEPTKFNDKIHSIRVIDHTDRMDTSVQSPASITQQSDTPAAAATAFSPAGLDDEQQVEPFEPILSDEEIGEEAEQSFDVDDTDIDFNEEIIKSFIPGLTQLNNFTMSPEQLNDKITQDVEMFGKLLLKYQSRDDRATENNFNEISPDSREAWVNTAEQFAHQLQIVHNFDFNRKDNILTNLAASHMEQLISWIKISLNFDCIMLQPQPGYKIRHLKLGARLTEFLCSVPAIIQHLLNVDNFNIFNCLFDLYDQKYMALSIKLMLIKAIYSCLDSHIGIEYFLNQGTITGYQRLINTIQENPLTRPKFALKSLLKKITLYESLQLIQETISNVYQSTDDDVDDDDNTIDAFSEAMQLLLINLEVILQAYTWDELSYTQPKRFLPVASKFEIVKDSASAKALAYTFYTYFNTMNLLHSLLMLIANEDTIGESLMAICLNIIEIICRKYGGLYLLSNNIEVTNELVKCLLDVPMMVDEDIQSESSTMFQRKQQLGTEIAYKIKASFLLEIIAHGKDSTDLHIVDALHELYSLTLNQFGRYYVANTIGLDNNITILLNIIDKVKEQEGPRTGQSATDKYNNVTIGYAIDLIDVTIRMCNELNYIEEHVHNLLDLIKNPDIFDQSMATKLQEMAIYLKPFELSNPFGYDNITPLSDLIKRNIEFITSFPGDLIMAIRLLHHLAISKYSENSNDLRAEYIEMKYKFVVLQFYTNDGVSLLITILEKINNHFEQPELHAATLASNQGILVTQLLRPTIEILNKMLTYVIQSRNTQFKDLTAIEHLVKTYTFMHHYQAKCLAYYDAQWIQRKIVETLLAYTQPSPIEGVDTESVHKSLWAQMIGEILKQILIAPRVHVPGIMLFTELLPKPLPVYTIQPLIEAENVRLKTERQLWSAHLHAKSSLLTELIQTICSSNDLQLKAILHSLSIQLADLAPNMALVVIKSIAELILNDCSGQCSITKQTIRLLELILILIQNAQIKMATITILPGKLLDYLCGILMANTTVLHGTAQELTLEIFTILLNRHICIVRPENMDGIPFTSALPTKDVLPLMISGVIDVFALGETTNTCRQLALKTLNQITEIDYTLFLLRAIMEKKKDSLRTALEKCINWDNADCHLFIKMFIEFLNNLLQKNHTNQSEYRTISLRSIDLASIIGWPIIKTEEKSHFLLTLQAQIRNIADDNVNVQQLTSTLINLIDMLDNSLTDELDFTEPIFPVAVGIVAQYSARSIFVLTNYYIEPVPNHITPTVVTDNNENGEKITIDLCDLMKTNLPPEFNVIPEYKRLLHLSASPQSNRERTTTAPCFRTRRVEVEPSTGRPEKKIYVTRGRGFSRTPPTRGDLFRSRPPNTSRPPSLHVDDFLALETCGAQPTGPTGYNKLSRDIIGIRGGRGGRGRGFSGGSGVGVGGGSATVERGGRISSLTSGGTPGSGYRQQNNSTSTWQQHGSLDSANNSAQQHFRTATAEPVTSHFQVEYSTGHFGGGSHRGRTRGNTRPPRSFTR